jgi:predicted transcriptional regulator
MGKAELRTRTVTISSETHRGLRILAAMRNLRLSSLADEVLEEYVTRELGQSEDAEKQS